MLFYTLQIAGRSLRRNVGLSSLVVGGVALGVALFTLFAAVRHAFAKDPIPNKSDLLYFVRIDNWDPSRPWSDTTDLPPPRLSFRDTQELLQSKLPLRQTASFPARFVVFPESKTSRPETLLARVCTSDFFEMFQVPIKYGAAWGKAADEQAEQVVILGEELNNKLFGGANSVGQHLRIENREFRVVGVLDHFRPSVKYFDLGEKRGEAPEQMFVPFSLIRPMQIRSAGGQSNWKPMTSSGFEAFLASEASWIQMWVELKDRDTARAYHDFVDAYTLEQRKLGRLLRPLNNRVTPLLELLQERGVVPPESTAMVIVSCLFLAVCALNLMGVLLSKFLVRSAEIGVRRALGARRWDIFVQLIVECELLAVVGGSLGVGLALVGIHYANVWMMQLSGRGDLFHIDLTILAISLLASLVAGLLAGAYPAVRICRIVPAQHLKLQ